MHVFRCLLGVSPLQYQRQRVQAAWPGLTIEGLQDEPGRIQQHELPHLRLGANGPPRLTTVVGKGTLAQKTLPEALGIDGLVSNEPG